MSNFARLAFRLVAISLLMWTWDAVAAPAFIEFESGPVRPLAMSSDGTRLLAVNTPDNRLEIFSVAGDGLHSQGRVSVGLEPVAVAFRTNDEAWVVNHLSDSISIVRFDGAAPRVVRTLLVGDEPRDIVFAGTTGGQHAFITTAHRGQRRIDPALSGVPGAGDPRLTTAGIPRADVWVFDPAVLGNALGGKPTRIINLFGDTPRALAVSPDGATVYAAVFASGNQTTTVSAGTVCPNFSSKPCVLKGVTYPGGSPGPATNAAREKAPQVGLIVKYDPKTGHFVDPLKRNWDAAVRFTLPDQDVFAIDANTFAQRAAYAHVGTSLFNLLVHPASGKLYVTNTESNNLQRFEGPGIFAGSTVQGHLAESRISIIDPVSGSVTIRRLNKHLNYAIRPAPAGTAAHSLSTPLAMAITGDGSTLYVAAYGSAKVGVFSTASLESNGFDPTVASADYIEVPGGGPAGLVLDEVNQRLYVLTRFDNAVLAINLTDHQATRFAMYNPEPVSVVKGRPFLYDARLSSSNGEASCASCHLFGDMDQLAWDLGNPDERVSRNPLPIKLGALVTASGLGVPINGTGVNTAFHPMKGPMTTQTLRGMANHGAMHWRGDRATGVYGTEARRVAPFDARLSLRNFVVAFQGLLGRSQRLSDADMNKFTDFTLQIVMPPNPVRALDNQLNGAQARGAKFYFGCDSTVAVNCANGGRPAAGAGHVSDGVPGFKDFGFTCDGCHVLNPASGQFGTDGQASFERLPQIAKVPQLRNAYQKVGMFGMPAIDFIAPGDNLGKGPQVRGFGFLQDGSVDTLFRFFNATVFAPDGSGVKGFTRGAPQRRDVEQFMLAFDSDLPPIVGQQATRGAVANAAVDARIALFMQQAATPFASKILGVNARECDLVVKGNQAGREHGWLYRPDLRRFVPDVAGGPVVTLSDLRVLAAAPEGELTFTCVPFGSGQRVALDRDRDRVLNGDELP